MDIKNVVIIGAGGHAKVIVDSLSTMPQYKIIALLDSQSQEKELLGVPILGGDEQLPDLIKQGVKHALIAIGDNKRRKTMALKLTTMGFQFINAVSQHAIVSKHAILGQGICIMPGAVINAGTQIGDHTIINTNSSIDHDCNIAAFSHIAPGATLAGHVTLEEGCFVGTGSSIIPNISLGQWTNAAAGSVIVTNAKAAQQIKGTPAKAY